MKHVIVTNGNAQTHISKGNVQSSFLQNLLPQTLVYDEKTVLQHIREGRFQRSLSLITAFSSLLSGLEVTYEHNIGSYRQQIM